MRQIAREGTRLIECINRNVPRDWQELSYRTTETILREMRDDRILAIISAAMSNTNICIRDLYSNTNFIKIISILFQFSYDPITPPLLKNKIFRLLFLFNFFDVTFYIKLPF